MSKLLNLNGGAWGLLTVHVLSTGYFHVKIKFSEENLRVDYYLLLKYLQNLTQMQNHKRIFDQVISQGRFETI